MSTLLQKRPIPRVLFSLMVGMSLGCFHVSTALAAASARPPLRIVSLGPAITEQRCLVDCVSNLVGVTTFCQLPAAQADLPKVGSITGINVEQILSLQPDLVLAISLTDPRTKSQLEKLGVRVVSFSYARSFDEICEQFLQIGTLVERATKAESLVRDVRRRVDALTESTRSLSAPKVFMEIGARPLFSANADTYIHDLILRAGGVNIAADSVSGFYSREQVMADDPDVIVVVTMGVAAEQERAAWLKATTLAATRHERIYIMDADTVCSPTPLRFAQALSELTELLHPGARRAP